MTDSVYTHSNNAIFERLCDYMDVLKERVAIGVVYAGDPSSDSSLLQKTSNTRSWKSYKSVAEQIAQALRKAGFAQVEILAEGSELQAAVQTRKFQLYWLNTGGMQGRDPMSHAPAFLENMGIPYIGHSPLHAALLDDKVAFKQWLRGIGLPTAAFVVRGAGFSNSIHQRQPDFIKEFGFDFDGPFLIKPANGRGSIDVSIAESTAEAETLVAELCQRTNSKVIVEQMLAGAEYCVWASRGIRVRGLEPQTWQNPHAFGPLERLYSHKQRVFRKIENPGRVIDPARALGERDEIVRDGLLFLGKTIFTHLALATPIRLDVRRDRSGALSVLEVNPKPDISVPVENELGLLSVALNELECSYDDFILKIVFDWLDHSLRFRPRSLSFIGPLFERYSLGDYGELVSSWGDHKAQG